MTSTAARTRPRRWIAAEIESLDPATDYEAIWRLTSSYGLNDFALNLIYAHVFPHFYLPPHGSRPLWDGGDGKVVERALQRVEDTIRNNLLWWFHGPGHPKTRQSVAGVNKLHAYHARRHPGVFAHQDDYVFTLAFSAASLLRFNLKVGLSGYTDKQKVAAHRFWQHMAELFVDEHRNKVLGFPPDWDSLIAYIEDFESRPWPSTESGRWSPRPSWTSSRTAGSPRRCAAWAAPWPPRRCSLYCRALRARERFGVRTGTDSMGASGVSTAHLGAALARRRAAPPPVPELVAAVLGGRGGAAIPACSRRQHRGARCREPVLHGGGPHCTSRW